MYESFDDEKRTLFRDVEKYKTLADLWKEFSLYLIAKKTNYHRYRVLYLTDKITIESRRGRKIGSGPQERLYGGLVLLKKIKWYRRKRKVLIIDHSKVVAVHGKSEKPEDFMDQNPVIIGMDLDAWGIVEFALSEIKAKRERLSGQRSREMGDFKQRITGRIESHKDAHNDSRYDLLDLDQDRH